MTGSCRTSLNGLQDGRKRTIEKTKNNGFSSENNRKYVTIQPMKYSFQQVVRPYPGEGQGALNLFFFHLDSKYSKERTEMGKRY